MKKKLVCLTLSIVMLLSCLLTGCSTKVTEEDEDTVDNTAKTITMWVMTPNVKDIVDEVLGENKSGQTEDERIENARELLQRGQQRVAEAFTEITKSLYKTNVILKFCEEDEYYAKLEESINALANYESLKEEAEQMLRIYLKIYGDEGTRTELTDRFYSEYPRYASLRQELEAAEEEDDDEQETEATEENEYGMTVVKYPDEKANQVDIFYLGGRDKYYEYYQNEWLASLDEELSASATKLNQYVSPALLNGVRIDGSVYGIPNNVPVGEYTYMFIDKKMFDETYNSGAADVTSILDLSNFLKDIPSYYGESVVPIASTFEECLKMLVWFWDLDYLDASVYDTVYNEDNGRNYVVVDGYKYAIDEDKTTDRYNPLAYSGMKYKTNADHKFVDKDGKVLNYTYEFDSKGGYLRTIRAGVATWLDDTMDDTKKKESLKNISEVSMYLVDENGDPVTPENDKRVILYDDTVEYDNARKTMSITIGEGDEAYTLTLKLGSRTAEYVKSEEGITSVDANGDAKPTYYYSYNPDADFSLLGQTMLDRDKLSRGDINLAFKSLFLDEKFRNVYETLKEYSYKGLFGQPTGDQLAAVSFVKGDSQIIMEAEREDKEAGKEKGVYTKDGRDYYVVVAKYPEASEKELYGNMFCVYEGSNYVNRSMEVITRINTNTELRNLLQYGILGEHYELNADGTAHLLADTTPLYLPGTDKVNGDAPGVYRMDIEKTGNCFMAAPQEADGPDVWEYAKKQNEAALINPLLGFDFNTELADSENTLDVGMIHKLKQYAQEAQEGIDECLTMADLKELLETDDDSYKSRYTTSNKNYPELKKATNSNYDPASPLGPEAADQTPDLNGESPYTIYYKWMTNNGYLPTGG